MSYEELASITHELRKKITYIVAVVITGIVVSFSLMGRVINKIESDMFWSLIAAGENDSKTSLDALSSNISAISKQLAVDHPDVSRNLTKIAGDLANISGSMNPHESSIIFLSPLEVLMLKLKMSLVFGILIASPIILYYAYNGIKPRLVNVIPLNRSLLVSTITALIVLFLLGATYSYKVMLPLFLKYIYQDALNSGVNPTFSVYQFIYFILTMTVIIGLAFELPVITTLLVHLGFTTRQSLAYYRRHAYIVLLVVAALITPDPTFFSQIMVTVPFIVLYEASLLLMKVTGR